MGQFSERIREVRMMRGITQEQLAEMADISRVMIGRYETTDQLPAVDTLIRIADALGISADYLLGRTDTLDATFAGRYVEPPKLSRSAGKLPKTAAEMEVFVREIVEEVLRENKLSEKR
ncbi:MAG: helix-turn-helix transcriptional regulator [Clostridia bacterium]|nr:helix-turn-helix transcriptional regulator [Clostridia bacterium]